MRGSIVFTFFCRPLEDLFIFSIDFPADAKLYSASSDRQKKYLSREALWL
jgi:hypothetical protein